MRTRLLTLVLALVGWVCLGTSQASAQGIGLLPPQVPAANCTAGASQRSVLNEIDFCRAQEGVGPLVLPANFGRLTVPEQLLTLINLERVNRGLPADIGLNATLNGLAQKGAVHNTDPGFPNLTHTAFARPFVYDTGGSIWAATDSVLDADLEWMYDDGAGSGNLACSSTSTSGCWGHRGIMLSDQDQSGKPLVGGGGYSAAGEDGLHSYAFEQLYGYSSQLTWAWQPELRAFGVVPKLERELPPHVTSASLSDGTITLTGTNLIGMTSVSFSQTPGSQLFCATETQCTVKVATTLSSTVSVVATDLAGTLRGVLSLH